MTTETAGRSAQSRSLFTISKGLPGAGFTRPEWNAIKDMQSGTFTRTIPADHWSEK